MSDDFTSISGQLQRDAILCTLCGCLVMTGYRAIHRELCSRESALIKAVVAIRNAKEHKPE